MTNSSTFTETEWRVLTTMSEHVRFAPESKHWTFIYHLHARCLHDPRSGMDEEERAYLKKLVWRYRRQLPPELVNAYADIPAHSNLLLV